MKALRLYALLIIAVHWIVAAWHLFLVAKILPAPENNVNWVAIGILTLLHFVALIACWKLCDRFTGLVLGVFFVLALGAGLYEHFLDSGLNNIVRVRPSDWVTAFRASVFLLVVIEMLGCWLGIRLLQRNSQTRIKVAQ